MDLNISCVCLRLSVTSELELKKVCVSAERKYADCHVRLVLGWMRFLVSTSG